MGIGYGASSHICSSFQDLASERRLRPNEVTLKLKNGASVVAKSIGSTSIDLYNHVLLLEDVLHNAYKNIVSISSLTRKRVMNSYLVEMYVRFILEMNWLAWVI